MRSFLGIGLDNDSSKSKSYDNTLSECNYYDPTNDIKDRKDKVRLKNVNFSCYVNVVFQILLHSSKLWKLTTKKFGNEELLLITRSGYSSFEKIDMESQGDAVLFLNWIFDQFENKKLWNQKWLNRYTCQICKKNKSVEESRNVWRMYSNHLKEYFEETEDGEFIHYDGDMSDMLFNQSHDMVTRMCTVCGCNTNHTKLEKIAHSPKYMFFHIFNIVNQKINYYLTFDLKIINTLYTYDLLGFIVHIGDDNAGHYVIYLLDSDNEWYLYDDDNIYKIECIEDILDEKSPDRKIVFLWYIINNIESSESLV